MGRHPSGWSTFRLRLTLWNVAVLALILGAMGVVVRVTVQADLFATVDRTLAERAHAERRGFSRRRLPMRIEEPNLQVKNQVVVDEEVDIHDKFKKVWYLGPNTEFRECRITFRVPSKALILVNGVRFVNCEIVAKVKHSGIPWVRAVLEGCKLSGSYSGCDFGTNPSFASPPGKPQGSIVRCDFTEAVLAYCRFYRCDMSTIRLAGWPTITIFDRAAAHRDYEATAGPKLFRPPFDSTYRNIEGEVALVHQASAIDKDFGPGSADWLRGFLAGKPYAHL